MSITPTPLLRSFGPQEFPVSISLHNEGIQRKEIVTPARPAAENVQASFRDEENRQVQRPAFGQSEADEHQRTKNPLMAQSDAT